VTSVLDELFLKEEEDQVDTPPLRKQSKELKFSSKYKPSQERLTEATDWGVRKPKSKFSKIGLGSRTSMTTSFENIPKKAQAAPKMALGDKELMSSVQINAIVSSKTPLDIAADTGNLKCIHIILREVFTKPDNDDEVNGHLSLATLQRSPATIFVLMKHSKSQLDHVNAIMIALQEMQPSCLIALLSDNAKTKACISDVGNLYHILYTQSGRDQQYFRYDLLPVMTRILLRFKLNVNDCSSPVTFPLHTLINCAIMGCVKQDLRIHYMRCLTQLLIEGADPHFDEQRINRVKARRSPYFQKQLNSNVCRKSEQSAICSVFSNINTLTFTSAIEPEVLNRTLNGFIVGIVRNDYSKTTKHNRDTLFKYFQFVCRLGLDANVLNQLLVYGADPDLKLDGKYAINVYFDNLVKFLRLHESRIDYAKEIECLMQLCRAMDNSSLKEAIRIFLDEHLMTTPYRALPVTRYFCYLVDKLTKHPGSLRHQAAKVVWVDKCHMNARLARALPVSEYVRHCVIPHGNRFR